MTAEATQTDQLQQRQLVRLVEAALEELEQPQREVFALYEIEGMTMAEVARALGLSENTALYRLYAGASESRPTSSASCDLCAAAERRWEGERMSELETPQRWLEAENGACLELRDGLQAYAKEGPSEAQHARMKQKLAASMSSAALPSASLLLKGLASIGALALVLAAVSSWSAQRTVAPAPSATPKLRVTEPLAQDITPIDTPPPAERSALESASPSGTGGTEPRPFRPAKATRSDSAGELMLLGRARRTLSSEPTRTLELTAEHARDHAHGTFAEERELLAIEALLELARTNEAHARAARFRRRYPRSLHFARLDVLLRAE